MTAALGGQSVTVLDAPLVTDPRYGTKRRDWTAATSTEVTGCSVQPFSADEVLADREFTATRLKLFAPFDATIAVTSRVRFEAIVYEVDGEPARWRDDMGTASHLEIVLKRLVG